MSDRGPEKEGRARRELLTDIMSMHFGGQFEGAVVFLMCFRCSDLIEARPCSALNCARCGCPIADRLPHGMYSGLS